MEFVWILLGILIGVILCIFFLQKKPSGTFIIDFSDPMGETFRLEWTENLNNIYSKKKIVLRVVTVDGNSQK